MFTARSSRTIPFQPHLLGFGLSLGMLWLWGSTTTAQEYYPPPESKGGWRKLETAEQIQKSSFADPRKLQSLARWLIESDQRDFAAVIIQNGHIVLEVERGANARTDHRRVASVSKAVCATVLAIAAEQSQRGDLPRKMSFDDLAFDYLPWAQPVADPRKSKITIRQLLNHTSGICPEATGAKNDGNWEYILGSDGNEKTAKLAFDPGTACGYSTHAFHHASLVCETVTGKPYDRFAVEALFQPIGCERWWFQILEGGDGIGAHPSHGMGMPARDLARIAYCMLHQGKWGQQQIIPKWFVEQTGAPSHTVHSPEMRFQRAAQSFVLGWELPSLLETEAVKTIPKDARYKPGSGGQLIAFVPSLDLVVARQTGGSGAWEYENFLRLACDAVTPRLGVSWKEQEVLGWKLSIHPRLIESEPAKTERAIQLLKQQLQEIETRLPERVVRELRKVPLWFSPLYPGIGASAEYHPGAGWLQSHGRDPKMAKGIEFTNIEIFEEESRRMPNFALHELAHAYHDRVLDRGFDNPRIKEQFAKAKASGTYEQVERQDAKGNRRLDRAYAMTNPQEYFAESTEAYFSRNDFYPFDREELKRHDPEMFQLLGELFAP